MFSEDLRKIDQVPHKKLWLVASGMVIVCQLVAMALVAGEQVQKAQMRSDSDILRQAAVASCVETRRGEAVKGCFLIGSSELTTRKDTTGSEVRADAPTFNTVTKGFMSASLDTH